MAVSAVPSQSAGLDNVVVQWVKQLQQHLRSQSFGNAYGGKMNTILSYSQYEALMAASKKKLPESSRVHVAGISLLFLVP